MLFKKKLEKKCKKQVKIKFENSEIVFFGRFSPVFMLSNLFAQFLRRFKTVQGPIGRF